MIDETDFCEFCDGIIEPRLIEHTFKRNGRNFAFKDVKALVCRKCGEIYIDGEAMRKIEAQIKEKVFASV
jgi:YgiT-type zinc finger domain-containing protein